jgi:anti-sigma-K factor RskA
MTDELKFPDPIERRVARDADSLDERTARAIHEAYLPPVGRGDVENAYWSALEQRIMARVANADPGQRDQGSWSGSWSVLNGWAQVGLVAAAALFAVGGIVSQQLDEPEEQVAYESVVPSSTPEAISAPAALMTVSDKSAQRDAALQYVLSY